MDFVFFYLVLVDDDFFSIGIVVYYFKVVQLVLK